ncbi:MAG: hypothetical protein R3E70_15510 [Burkholderiaceae bacterium]
MTLTGADWSQVANDVYDEQDNFLGRGVHIGFTAANGLADDGHFIAQALHRSPSPRAGRCCWPALAWSGIWPGAGTRAEARGAG